MIMMITKKLYIRITKKKMERKYLLLKIKKQLTRNNQYQRERDRDK